MSEEPAEYNIAYKDNVDKLGSKSKTVAAILKKQWDDLADERNELLEALKENQAVLKYVYNDIQGLPVRTELVATVATKIQENRAAIEKVTPKPNP